MSQLIIFIRIKLATDDVKLNEKSVLKTKIKHWFQGLKIVKKLQQTDTYYLFPSKTLALQPVNNPYFRNLAKLD